MPSIRYAISISLHITFIFLEQSCDHAVCVYVNVVGSRFFRQTRHGEYVACECNDKSGAGAYAQFAYSDFKAGRRAEFCLVITQGILRFCHADWHFVKTRRFQFSDGLFNGRSVVYAVSAVNPATPMGVMLLSAPPATITSASPCWIDRMASPMEWVPVAQAVTTLMLFPFSPN